MADPATRLVDVGAPGVSDGNTSVTVARFDLWSVARVAIVFWSCIGAMVIAAFIVTWLALSSAGVVSNVEHFVVDVTGLKRFRVTSNEVLSGIALLVFVGVIVSIAITVLAAASYNAIAALTGGLRIKSEPVVPPKRFRAASRATK